VSGRGAPTPEPPAPPDGAPTREPPAPAEGSPDAPRVKPRLRGVTHKYAFFVSLGVAGPLVVAARGAAATVAASVYAAAIAGLFGISALYHRIDWSPRARRRMRRLDHSMIFVMIAGTYTPIALLALDGAWSVAILSVVWGGAALGIVLKLVWLDAPGWLVALIYVLLGWAGTASLPWIAANLGVVALLGILAGGVLYSIGAIVYARERPDPVPAVFGYHEIFHVLVIGAALLHFAVVVIYVLPRAG
jgi:hemolysin III